MRLSSMRNPRETRGWPRAFDWVIKAVISSWILAVILVQPGASSVVSRREKRGTYDQSVRFYVNDRTCYWNEPCKEEFQSQFRCKCPAYSYCRGPGKYYNAYCDMNRTGYIWIQPEAPEEEWRWKERVMTKGARKSKSRNAKPFKMKPLRAMSLEMRKG